MAKVYGLLKSNHDLSISCLINRRTAYVQKGANSLFLVLGAYKEQEIMYKTSDYMFTCLYPLDEYVTGPDVLKRVDPYKYCTPINHVQLSEWFTVLFPKEFDLIDKNNEQKVATIKNDKQGKIVISSDYKLFDPREIKASSESGKKPARDRYRALGIFN